MQKTDLSKFNNQWYNTGASWFTRATWYCVNICFVNSYFHFYSFKFFLLRMFGARIGKNVIIKPKVNIKYPWNIEVGDNVWIGENVWLDSLGKIKIGANVCLSQGAMLICGNHNYKKKSFDLIVGNIILEDGVWIGAGALVCGGVICKSHAVLTAGSVATDALEPFSIYQGNPAIKIKDRIISE
ncbi:MAG: WcaF family extracellular polysaccharide biosynthesis acetyltransferase [Bacteroidota bacterium]